MSKLLVKAGADVKASTSRTGATPLDLAAEEGHVETMRILIEARANPNSRMFNGSTALSRSAARGRVDANKVLLGAKANPLLTRSTAGGKAHVPLDTGGKKGALGGGTRADPGAWDRGLWRC